MKGTMVEVQNIIGNITSQKCQIKKTVTQSSTESKYITLLEASKEKKTAQMTLQEIDDVETLGYIYGDNEASVFWLRTSKYQIEKSHTTHSYIRCA